MIPIPMRIEQYCDEEISLWEITDLTVDRLLELDRHLNMSVLPLSHDFRELHKELKKLISSLDVRKAS
jgi:hypothetical protein